MISTAQSIENLTLNLTQEIHVRAPMDVTFAALLEQIGPENDTPDGQRMPMKVEPWPGGRWYRDLGDGNGHFWGHVQAIKRPDVARDHRTVVHVLPGCLECAVPAERGGRWNADQVPPYRPGTHPGGPPRRCRKGLDPHPRSRPRPSRRQSFKVSVVGVGERHVSSVYGERGVGGGRRGVDGRAYRGSREAFSFQDEGEDLWFEECNAKEK